jgi:death-on-curing protein
MISKELVLKLNQIIAESSEGPSGIGDEKSLLLAINRHFQTFDEKDLYPSAIVNSIAIFQSIIVNHPFIDAKKQMVYAFLRLLLFEDGFDIDADDDDKYKFVIDTSQGILDFEQIKGWIISNLKR